MKFLKVSLIATAISASFSALAATNIVESEKGSISIGGDVEFDINYQDKEKSDNSNFDQTGRILIEFAGERGTDSGHFIKFNAQPLMDTSGSVNLDDAWFAVGMEDNWELRIGRFEAYDMFPVGQDTFLEYHGDTADDLYTDNAGYVYQLKEGRGRAGSAGQIMYSQTFGNLYTELSATIGDRSDLFNNTYHGKEIEGASDGIILRPVVAYQVNDFKIAASIETNLVNDTVIFTDGSSGDIGSRIGYGLNANYSKDSLSVNVNAAYLDALNENDSSLGVNVLWKGFGIGYVYAVNGFDAASNWHDGKVVVDATYASYEFSNVLNIEDFSVYLGAFYTTVNDQGTSLGSHFEEGEDLGGRIRIKYFF